jgi:tripartite-type tricarboxylate transporter receptor subunit TctC
LNKSACVAFALLVVAAVSASAQNYPARTITLIVPFAAGGPSDALARLIAQSMSATLGQQVAVEDVTGAGGTLGAAKGAQAKPDGYTILLSHVPAAPELPTPSEAGPRDFDLPVWYGLVVPKGTPKPVADQFAAALRGAISDATVVKRVAEFDAQPVSQDRATPEAFAAFFRADVAKWPPVIKAAGVYAD